MFRVFEQRLLALDLDDTIDRAAARSRRCQRHFPVCDNAVRPCGCQVNAALLIPSGAPYALGKHIDVLIKAGLTACNLQFIQNQRQIPHKRRRALLADHSAVEGLDIPPYSGVRPDRCRKHFADGLACLRTAPEVQEEG